MAAVTTELKVLVRAVGKNDIDTLSKTLTKLGKAASQDVDPNLKKSVAQLRTLSLRAKQTEANIRGFSNSFKELARNLEFGTKEFKEATAEAARLDAQLEKLQKRRPTRGQRLARGARTAGAVAAASVFGGPEGAIGAVLGGIFGGGPAGAAVGGAIGATVGGARQQLAGTSEYAAELQKLRIALRGVSGDAEGFQKSLQIIDKVSADLAINKGVLTRQFTKLQASVEGSGGTVDDTKLVFEGITAAVRATGGSLQDVDSALTATSQVFSKGKVSAEELRQQIGERLPGAFTLFATSLGKTPEQLDKLLEQGKVSLSDFENFAKLLLERYGEQAKIIADSPAAAGDRLQKALSDLSEQVGILLAPIGAAFQDTFTKIAEVITPVVEKLNEFFGLGKSLDEQIAVVAQQIEATKSALEEARGPIPLDPAFEQQRKALAELTGIPAGDLTAGARGAVVSAQTQALENSLAVLQAQLGVLEGTKERLKPKPTPKPTGEEPIELREDFSEKMVKLQLDYNQALLDGNAFEALNLQYKIDLQKILEDVEIPAGKKAVKTLQAKVRLNNGLLRLYRAQKNPLEENNDELTRTEKLTKNIAVAFRDNMAQGISDVILKARSLGDVLSNVLKMAANLFIQFGVKTLFSTIPGFDKIIGSANGNVFYQNKVVPFARGGIVNQPTIFPLANGAGVMGEQGPEAIMPLRRGPSGRLGVEAAGGAGGNVVVNVDASGSAVQGDSNQAAQLGKAIGSAVQAELIKQKRPGGLLAGV